MDSYKAESMVKAIRQSPPVDLSIPYAARWVKDKTILITGGASGFGAGFVRHWAKNGAAIVVGDINTEKGDALVREVRKETGNDKVHFLHCDVTDWQSQVNLFKEAARLSPHGGIDVVVANAGIAGGDPTQMPKGMNAPEPPKPNFKILDVNLMGVMYTTHLAYWWLPRNPGSVPCSMESKPGEQVRDRHLLLLGSIASIAPIAMQPQYGAAKHGVLGLFRSLRSSSHMSGVRVNLILPYFIDTPIVTTAARFALAGGAMGKVEDIVNAATRFVADSRILGRALVIGPKITVKQMDNGEWGLVSKDTPGSKETALWEPCADDWEDVDAFDRNFVKLINSVQAARGWIGWATDIVRAIGYGLGFGR
jgi:NAD(P)-dependent dehydrogenase (short-subunit alcohol dehydrogenase family)